MRISVFSLWPPPPSLPLLVSFTCVARRDTPPCSPARHRPRAPALSLPLLPSPSGAACGGRRRGPFRCSRRRRSRGREVRPRDPAAPVAGPGGRQLFLHGEVLFYCYTRAGEGEDVVVQPGEHEGRRGDGGEGGGRAFPFPQAARATEPRQVCASISPPAFLQVHAWVGWALGVAGAVRLF